MSLELIAGGVTFQYSIRDANTRQAGGKPGTTSASPFNTLLEMPINDLVQALVFPVVDLSILY